MSKQALKLAGDIKIWSKVLAREMKGSIEITDIFMILSPYYPVYHVLFFQQQLTKHLERRKKRNNTSLLGQSKHQNQIHVWHRFWNNHKEFYITMVKILKTVMRKNRWYARIDNISERMETRRRNKYHCNINEECLWLGSSIDWTCSRKNRLKIGQ